MTARTGRPEVCAYCHPSHVPEEPNSCGFCENGVPLDTQEDWDRTWGRTWEQVDEYGSEVPA